MQTLFDNSSTIAEPMTLLEELAAEEAKPKDSFFGVQLVLVIAEGISMIALWLSPVVLF